MAVDDDYGFVVGTTSWENMVRDLIGLRPDSTLIPHSRRRRTVRHFLLRLRNASSIDRPVGDLLIGAHANKKAFLKIKIDPRQRRWTTYETLLEAVSSGRINIHSSLSDRNSGDPPMHFHILGCNIGKARPFISKLKEALGNVAIVTAPKHSHSTWDLNSYKGIFEFMRYTFVSGSPTELTTHDQVVALFKASPAHRLINGDEIDDDDWERWVAGDDQVNTSEKIVTHRLAVRLGTTINGKNVLRRVSVKYVRWTKGKTYRIRLSSDPGSEAARRAALENYLSTQHASFTRPDFPEWEVWRFASLDDFIDGFTWTYSWDADNRKLVCRGVRYEYRIYAPVLRPDNNQLLFNFYPHEDSDSSHVFNLDISNSSLFQVV